MYPPRQTLRSNPQNPASQVFFIPIPRLTLLIIGVLAYCQRKYGLAFCAVAFLSNHAHMLVRARSADHARRFFCLANSQIAQEAQRFCDWEGGIFKSLEIVRVFDEREAQEERLKYILSQGVKEGLVPHPSKWPGVHCAKALLTGSMRMKGIWISRTKLWRRIPTKKRRKGAVRRWLSKKDFKSCEEHLALELSPLPSWEELDPKQRVKRYRELCNEIQEENQEARSRVPKDYRKRLMDRSRFAYRPPSEKKRAKRRNRPKVHAASLEEWKRCVDELDAWYDQYARASERLRDGILEAVHEFPEQAFLPTGIILPTEAMPPPKAV